MRAMVTLVTLLGVVLALRTAAAEEQKRFPTPEAAAKALQVAARAGDAAERLRSVLGPDSDDLVSSGDPVDDAATLRRFTNAVNAKQRVEVSDDGAHAVLHIGRDDWPFPIPIVRDGDGWRFDTAAGKEELLNRRIGRNELTAIAVCRGYVDAQLEYYARFGAFAASLRSSPGQRDGLYWEATSKDDVSPVGPFVASATAEGYRVPQGSEPRTPYHGYYFRVLKAQGKHAPGGARSWVAADGRMTGGFALVAWPADHGSSGVMSFMVGEQGVVFQKNLGPETSTAVEAITAYDPDPSWEPTR